MENNEKNKAISKKINVLISISIVIVLLLVAGLVYLLFFNGGDKGKDNSPTPTPTVTPIPLSLINAAKEEIIANGNYDTDINGEPIVYWTKDSTKYHININCPQLQGDDTIYSGTVEAAFQRGLTEPCRVCIKKK